ncbi:MAG: hypothetical protein NVSMB66_4590 [Candidatus Doudnabacteria bacterium]
MEYEKLAKLIQSNLRKNFRRQNENAFENSIAQINDELATIAASGQTAWVGKMNALLAVRQKDSLFISTTGKIHAYLFRDKQLSDIADSPSKNNPLKTFENFAVGKVIKKDYLIFTTTQLLNYISVERLKELINKKDLAEACQSIATIIKDLADESISFGTFILELGSAKIIGDDNILKLTIVNNADSPKMLATLKSYSNSKYKKAVFTLSKFKNPTINLKDVTALLIAKKTKELSNIKKLKDLPKAKKFFLGSALLFFLVLLTNVFVAIHIRQAKKLALQAQVVFTTVQNEINNANSAYIYNDKNKAMSLLKSAQDDLAKVPASKAFDDQKNKVAYEITELQNSIGGLKTADPTELISLGSGSADLLKSAGGKLYLININKDKSTITSFQNNSLGPSFTFSGKNITAANTTEQDVVLADSKGLLYILDFAGKKLIAEAGQIQAEKGLAFYGSPIKAFSVKPSTNEILTSKLFSKDLSTNYLKEPANLAQTIDLAIDGAVYVLFPDHIQKYTGGHQKPFSNANLGYSPNSKIYANNSWKYIYVLDPSAKKLVILDKFGALKAQYTSRKFSDLKDMVVDENARSIYLLNGNSILKFQLSM